MTRVVTTLRLNVPKVERYLGVYLSAFRPRSTGTLRLHNGTVRRFLRSLGKYEGAGQIVLTEKRLVEWLVEQADSSTVSTVAQRWQTLSRFFDALTAEGLINANPMRQFEAQFGKHRWLPIARALKSGDPEAALEALRVVPPLSGPLGQNIREYLALKRSVGIKCEKVEYTLTSLDVFLRSHHVASAAGVDERMIRDWESGKTWAPPLRRAQLHMVKAFFNYLVGLGIIRSNPCTLTELPRSTAPAVHPYIYSRQEITALLDAARKLPANHLFRLRPQTGYTLIALLYALGLRIGEALRLQFRDVDFEQGFLFIRQTKFHKSRTVPFGPRVGRCLRDYLAARRTLFTPVRDVDPLFVAYRPTHLSAAAANTMFHGLLAATHISPANGHLPRPHDLRHTFAVHRLLHWYREGVDVQSKLPLLSTFLGHIEIASTQVYLTITGDLLNEASGRFQRHFGGVFAMGGRS